MSLNKTGILPPTDIRSILKERLEEAREERQRLQNLVKEAEQAELGYARALEAEVRRHEKSVPDPDQPNLIELAAEIDADRMVNGSSTKEFLLSTMKEGVEWSLDALKIRANQANLRVPLGSSLGRMLHGALLGLSQSGYVEMVSRGVWRKK